MDKKTKAVRLATFLHVIGKDGNIKYDTFTFTQDEDENNLDTIIEKFEQDCREKVNELNERFIFMKSKQ